MLISKFLRTLLRLWCTSHGCVWSAHALRAHCVLPLCLEIRQLLLLYILFALQPLHACDTPARCDVHPALSDLWCMCAGAENMNATATADQQVLWEKKAFVIVVRSFCACNPHCGENWIELHFNSSNYVTFELLGSGGRCTEPFISCGGWENHFCLFFWYSFSKLMWECWQIFFIIICVPTQQKWDAGDAQCGEN